MRCSASANIRQRVKLKLFFKTRTIKSVSHEAALELLLADNKRDVIRLVYFHFGYIPILESIQIVKSVHVEREPTKSQLYHLDYNLACVLKLFVYLSDVHNEDDGPFSAIRLLSLIHRLVPVFLIYKSRKLEAILSLLGRKLSFCGRQAQHYWSRLHTYSTQDPGLRRTMRGSSPLQLLGALLIAGFRYSWRRIPTAFLIFLKMFLKFHIRIDIGFESTLRTPSWPQAFRGIR